jgi:hypothetical protein
MHDAPRPPPVARAWFTFGALLLAFVALVFVWGVFWSDFDIQVFAARSLLAGENPYHSVGPDASRHWPSPYYYPLPAAFLALPLVWLSLGVIRVVFVLAGTGVLAWIASRFGLRYAPLFLSGAFLHNVMVGQWGILLTAALLAPGLAWIVALKPNFGAVFAVARWDRRYLVWLVAPAAALMVAALLLVPSWPFDWFAAVRSEPAHSPLLFAPGGFLLLLALVRWRTFEGRLLAGLAVIPQSGLLYDALPIWLIARTQAQGWILTTLSLAALKLQGIMYGMHGLGLESVLEPDFVRRFNVFREAFAPVIIALVYLPALAIVLWNGWIARSVPPSRSVLHTPAA